jgi:hypothetical protein
VLFSVCLYAMLDKCGAKNINNYDIFKFCSFKPPYLRKACLVGLLYLTQVTKTNGFGYTINNLQTQQSHLRDQQADLEVTAARLKSLDRVSSSNVAKNLVAATPSGVVNP